MHVMQTEKQQHMLNGDVYDDFHQKSRSCNYKPCNFKDEAAAGNSPLGQGSTCDLHGSEVFEWCWLIGRAHPCDFLCFFSKADLCYILMSI